MKLKNLNEHQRFLFKHKMTNLLVWSIRAFIFLAFFVLWEVLANANVIDSFLFSSPSRIVESIISLVKSGELYEHVGITLFETLMGFFIATALGTLIALLLWWSNVARKVLEPYIIILNSLPKIALGPIIIVWFGTGVKSIIFMAVIITIIITIITMLNGYLATDKNKILLLKSMGANKLQILSKLVIPSSTKTMIACLKINVGMAWIGSIMGEYLSSRRGIGYLIVYGGQVFKLDLVMASTLILCVLAGIMYLAVVLLEKILVKEK